jgi:hypothetical protein
VDIVKADKMVRPSVPANAIFFIIRILSEALGSKLA